MLYCQSSLYEVENPTKNWRNVLPKTQCIHRVKASHWHLNYKTVRATTPLELSAPGPAAAVRTRTSMCVCVCVCARMCVCVVQHCLK